MIFPESVQTVIEPWPMHSSIMLHDNHQCARNDNQQCSIINNHQCAINDDHQCAINDNHQCAINDDHQCAINDDHQCAINDDQQCAINDDHQCITVLIYLISCPSFCLMQLCQYFYLFRSQQLRTLLSHQCSC